MTWVVALYLELICIHFFLKIFVHQTGNSVTAKSEGNCNKTDKPLTDSRISHALDEALKTNEVKVINTSNC